MGELYTAFYGDGLFVINGSSGVLQTSPDGIIWTKRTPDNSTDSFNFYGGCYGNGIYVIVGTGNNGSNYTAIQTSTDAITWAAKSSAGTFRWAMYSVAYGNGIFVAVGLNGTGVGEIQTSTDGDTWTKRTPGSVYARNWERIRYINDRFILLGSYDAEIQTSTDGITWTHIADSNDNLDIQTVNIFYDVSFKDGTYIFVGTDSGDPGNGVVFTSTDLSTFSTQTGSGLHMNRLQCIAYGDDKFRIGGERGYFLTSTDCKEYTGPWDDRWTSSTTASAGFGNWDSTYDVWETNSLNPTLILNPIGEWSVGYTPTKCRISYIVYNNENDTNNQYVTQNIIITDASGTDILGSVEDAISGQEFNLSGTSDIGRIYISNKGNASYFYVYEIEFYKAGDRTASGSGFTREMPQNHEESFYYYDICYGDNRFISVGEDNIIQINNTKSAEYATGTGNNWTVHNNNEYVAI